ncbi:unnamed protein product [Paramecium sonneborni]|uniref:Uncharacterized protein n=1 Tax=Paramecium sonneborni TaxID=65129 RepID=A0A8S1RT04_9CILI|nr:unnamed protein product [Paramecium sonneborni]
MEFKYIVIIEQSINTSRLEVRFMKDNQFIFVTSIKEIDKIFIFELTEGVFEENQQKMIQLNQNKQNYYMWFSQQFKINKGI